MKIIDLLNKIAKGEEVPNKIKYKCDIYIIGEDVCNKYVKYINEKKDVDGYTKYLFQDWILDVILNDEIEIIEEVEDKEYEDIEELHLYLLDGNDSAMPTTLQDFNNQEIIKKINALIRNQKKILERLDK